MEFIQGLISSPIMFIWKITTNMYCKIFNIQLYCECGEPLPIPNSVGILILALSCILYAIIPLLILLLVDKLLKTKIVTKTRCKLYLWIVIYCAIINAIMTFGIYDLMYFEPTEIIFTGFTFAWEHLLDEYVPEWLLYLDMVKSYGIIWLIGGLMLNLIRKYRHKDIIKKGILLKTTLVCLIIGAVFSLVMY